MTSPHRAEPLRSPQSSSSHRRSPLSLPLSLFSLSVLLFGGLEFISGCGESGFETVTSNGISVEPRQLNFNILGAGQNEARNVEVAHLGETELVVSRIYLREVESQMERLECDRVERGIALGPLRPGEFVGCELIIDERPELPLTLENGQNRQVVLRYKPEGELEGEIGLELVVESNALDEKVSVVTISLDEGEPQLVADQVVSFSSEGGDQIIPLRNQGNGPLTISSVTIEPITPFYINPESGQTEPEFVWNSADGSTIPFLLDPVTGVATLRVTYSPQDEGLDEAELVIRSNDPLRPESKIKLTSGEITGTLEAEPASLSFEGGGRQLLTFRNSGERTVNVFDMRIEPADAGFSLDGNLTTSFPLPGGGMIERPVLYQPNGAEGGATLLLDTDADNAVEGVISIPLELL